MLHQFPHLGDLHLAPGARNADRIAALDQVIVAGLTLPRLAAWLWPGDLNHQRMSIDDRNLLADRLMLMANHAPVVIVKGNHDQEGDLDIFARLSAHFPIHVVTQPDVLSVKTATGAIALIACLPYPEKAALVGAGVAPDQVVTEAREALLQIFRGFEQTLDDAVGSAIPLFLGHVNVAGSIASTGQPQIGQEIELDAALLELLRPCYRGLNHIHRGQEIHGAHYAGSLCRLDWAEIDPKRWLLVEYSQDHMVGPVWSYTVTPQPIAVPAMFHVEGWLTREGFSFDVVDGPEGQPLEAPASWDGHDVRCRYRYHQSEKSVVDEALVRVPFAGARRVEFEPIAVPDRALRAPEVAAARTLPEKVQAWGAVTGTVIDQGVDAKLAQLSTADPEVVLTAVARQVAQLTEPQTATVAA